MEIHYETGEDKHILTKVRFPHDLNVRHYSLNAYCCNNAVTGQNELREEVVEKVKWNINRDSIEDKQRALLDLFEPLKKDLKHQVEYRIDFHPRAL